jgi:hypothetical protein
MQDTDVIYATIDIGGGNDSRDQPHDLANEIWDWQIGNHRGKKNQKVEEGYDEVVRQRRGKCHGVVLFHVANHMNSRVLEVE